MGVYWVQLHRPQNILLILREILKSYFGFTSFYFCLAREKTITCRFS